MGFFKTDYAVQWFGNGTSKLKCAKKPFGWSTPKSKCLGKKLGRRVWARVQGDFVKTLPCVIMICDFPQIQGGPQIPFETNLWASLNQHE